MCNIMTITESVTSWILQSFFDKPVARPTTLRKKDSIADVLLWLSPNYLELWYKNSLLAEHLYANASKFNKSPIVVDQLSN